VAGLGSRAVYAVQVAVDEACSNIMEHAYGGEGRGTIECTCRTTRDHLVIKLHDHGRPFDPATIPKPDLHADLAERHAGGLGLYFIQQLMDCVQFESTPEKGNTLTLTKRGETAAGPESP
jgi:serine/threonine-protein kinase RsbW